MRYTNLHFDFDLTYPDLVASNENRTVTNEMV